MSNQDASGMDARTDDAPDTFEAFAIKNIAPVVEGTGSSADNVYHSKSSFNDFEYWNRSISNIGGELNHGGFDEDDDEDIYAGDNEQIVQIVEYKEGKPVNRLVK